MKIPRAANAMGEIDEDLILEAAANNASKKKNRRSPALRWGALAASLVLVLVASLAIMLSFFGKDNGIASKYKNYSISGSEFAVEWPWAYKTIYEKYPVVDFSGKTYTIRIGVSVDPALLGEQLGSGRAEGKDIYTGKTYTENFEVRKIKGVSEELLVAVGMEGKFYVFENRESACPATWGEAMDAYGLAETLSFQRFTKCKGSVEKGSYLLRDDAYLWQVLEGCREAALVRDSDSFRYDGRIYLSFTATSEALGVYKRVFSITEDGYLVTNIFDYECVYYIGEEAAGEIIRYVEDNATEAESEPYESSVAGILTEIGEDYILVDDTILCRKASEGEVFKISLEDIRIRRCIDCTDVKVGDFVVVKYPGSVLAGNEIDHAYALYPGILVDGDVLIPE